MTVWDYTTHPVTGRVHLIVLHADHTLCDLRWEQDWQDGDETVSGIAATCATCYARARSSLAARS